MIAERQCINIWNDDWFDICILIKNEFKYEEAENVIRRAYDDWYDDEDTACTPIGDWISNTLTKNEIEHEMYYKSMEEEEE
jgi:hypothetical protein